MARTHYWQFILSDSGNPVGGAVVKLYEAGTENLATFYRSEFGGTAETQVLTDARGYFEMFLADGDDVNGYATTQKFKVTWAGGGVSDGYIDYIEIYNVLTTPVDETSTTTVKDKTVSNDLAKGWQDHVDAFHNVSDKDLMHGIEESDLMGTAFATSYGGGADTTVNRLVTEDFIHRIISREHQELIGLTDDDHAQYIKIDGRTGALNDITAKLEYDNSTAIVDVSGNSDAIPSVYNVNTLIDLKVRGHKELITISAGSTETITHSLGNGNAVINVNVQVWSDATNQDVTDAMTITYVDGNNVQVTGADGSYHVVVVRILN